MTKRKAEIAEEPAPRVMTPPKYGMTDPGKRIDPKRIEEMQARIFCGAPLADEMTISHGELGEIGYSIARA
jgi:hypothetical protein